MTVLHEYVYDSVGFEIAFLLSMVGAVLVASMLGVSLSRNIPKRTKIIMALLSVTITLGVVYSIIKIPPSMSVTRYKVKMEEKVDLNEFLSQYKIIETEGDIIVVEQIRHGE